MVVTPALAAKRTADEAGLENKTRGLREKPYGSCGPTRRLTLSGDWN